MRAVGNGFVAMVGLLLAAPGVASADGTVQVQVTDAEGRPLDGSVTLRGPTTRSCRTMAGRCTLSLPGGTYTATLAPVRGGAPPARSVRVPASGVISLPLRATTATAATPVTARPVQTSAAPGTTTARRPPGGTPALGGPRIVTRPATQQPVRPTTTAPGARPAVVRTGGGVTTSPGVTPVRPPSSQPAARPTTTRAVPVMMGRNLASGSRIVCQGSIQDSAGRPTDATITVSSGATVVGSISSTAGRFTIYDLSPGTYALSIRSTRGTTTSATMRLTGGVDRMVLRVP